MKGRYSTFWLTGAQLSPMWDMRDWDDVPDVDEWARLSDTERQPLEVVIYGRALPALGWTGSERQKRKEKCREG